MALATKTPIQLYILYILEKQVIDSEFIQKIYIYLWKTRKKGKGVGLEKGKGETCGA